MAKCANIRVNHVMDIVFTGDKMRASILIIAGAGLCLGLTGCTHVSVPVPNLGLLVPVGRLVVLRSFGKFYGLAGLRLGFIVAEPTVVAALRERLALVLARSSVGARNRCRIPSVMPVATVSPTLSRARMRLSCSGFVTVSAEQH